MEKEMVFWKGNCFVAFWKGNYIEAFWKDNYRKAFWKGTTEAALKNESCHQTVWRHLAIHVRLHPIPSHC